jgi:hypothetical protein
MLLMMAAALLSCSNAQTDFTITASSKTLILLDTSTKSCQAVVLEALTDDISSVYFSLPSITFSWVGSQTLTIHWVNFTLKATGLSSGGYSYTMGGDQLMYSFYNAAYDTASGLTAVTLPNVIAATGAAPTWINTCAYKVGSIPIIDKKKDIYGTAIITAYATYESNGETIPLTAKFFGDFFYKGNGL